VIKHFEEVHEHYNGRMNQIHFLSFSTDVSSNKVLTHKEAMTEEDAHLFVEAMQKEAADHELQNHWTIVHGSSVPRTAKLIQPIWTIKRKQRPDGTLIKHKARLCARSRMQQWGTNYTGKHTYQ
jgi:tRNA U34 5-methylaminomethyl-2-thiouridine-forming methyltransferase MnmC